MRLRSNKSEMPIARSVFPPGFGFCAPLIAGALLAGPNLAIGSVAIFTLLAGTVLLWRPGEVPVLLLTFWLGWFGSSVALIYCNISGIELQEFSQIYGGVDRATLCSLIGVLAMAIGMKIGRGKTGELAAEGRAVIVKQPTEVWFRLYIIALCFSTAAAAAIWVVPGLSQIMVGFVAIKFAFFFLLGVATLSRTDSSFSWFALAFWIELGLGLGGFFSDFKAVFLTTFLVLGTVKRRVSFGEFALSLAFISGFVALLVVWTAVKSEFRTYVAGGTGQQVVAVNYSDRMFKLFDLVTSLHWEKVEAAAYDTVFRLTYVEFFAAALAYVPIAEPHSNGFIIADALVRPFMPRLFFPDKAIIDDTARTNKYTGGLAGTNEGTSISLGYVAESYIDFGIYGMFAGLFTVGVIYGALHRLMLKGLSCVSLLGMGFSAALMQSVGLLENSFTKIFGGIVAGLIAAEIVNRFGLPRFAPWLVRQK